VKTLVLSHLVPSDDPSITEAMWDGRRAQALRGYDRRGEGFARDLEPQRRRP